jgi:hypothetical protein
MADFAAIAAVGKSIERVLNVAFSEHQPVAAPGGHARAVLVTTADLEAAETHNRIGPYGLSIFLYRVEVNRTMRVAPSSVKTPGGLQHGPPLALDLHYLLTAWADNAENEHRILGRALQAIESTAVLSGPLLDPSADWGAHETVQLAMEEFSTEAMVQIFDSLPTKFRLSFSCIARGARLDMEVSP